MIDHEFSTYFMFPDSMPRQMYWFEQLARSIQGDEVQRGEFDYLTKETERLTKEKAKLESEIKRVEGKLSNKGFTEKAPAAVVEEERQKGEKYKAMLEKVLESLKNLGA